MTDTFETIGAPAPAGHNVSPLDPEYIRETARQEHADLFEKCDALIAASERTPGLVTSEDDAGRLTDYGAQVSKATKALDRARLDSNGPYRDAVKACDSAFRPLIERLAAVGCAVRGTLTSYSTTKREREPTLAAQQAARQEVVAKEAREKAKAAEAAMKSDKDIPAALAADARAQVEEAAAAKAARDAADVKVSTTGEYGSKAHLRERWVGTIIERRLLDIDLLRPYFSDEALQKALSAGVRNGIRSCAGARIEKQTDVTLRG